MTKSKPVQFTRAEAEALMNLMALSSVQCVHESQLDITDRVNIKAVHESLPIAARVRTVLSLNAKIWEVWAETHPEEGPFK